MHSTTSRFRVALLLLACIPFIYPFVFLAFTALRPAQDYVRDPLGIPTSFTLDHVRFAWENAQLGPAMINSLIAVGLSVIILVPVSSLAAYWFLRHPGRISKALMAGLFALWAVPFIIYAIPLYVGMADVGLLNSRVSLGFVYAAMNIPFGVYLMYTYYSQGIPPEILESAQVDGAGITGTFWHVVAPLGLPAAATLAALTFVWSWGDLIVAAFLIQDQQNAPATLAAATLVSRVDVRLQPSAAAALLNLLPVLVVFLFAQRAITRGFAAGSVK